MTAFNEAGNLAPTGLHLGGTKCMIIQGEPETVIRGKKGAGGVTIKKTGGQVLDFGIYAEPVTPGQCNLVVERLGDYLADFDIYAEPVTPGLCNLVVERLGDYLAEQGL